MKAALARPTDRGEPFTSLEPDQAAGPRASGAGIVPAISRSQLWRILHEAGIRFQHHKTWKTSPDPEFEAKKNRILDLYANPPAGGRVLCLDEFGPLNLQPRLGHGWHPIAAARPPPGDVQADGRASATCSPPTTRPTARCTATSATTRPGARSGSCCAALRARFGEHLIVVLDNFSPHKKTELRAWAAEHDIEFVFLPTYSSWLNLIECQFQALRSFALNGSDYREPRRAGRRDPRLPAWHNEQRPAGQALAHQGRGPPFAPERCGMRH